jgi:Na+/H+ antiporter NhaD/arsenite permease-like protein
MSEDKESLSNFFNNYGSTLVESLETIEENPLNSNNEQELKYNDQYYDDDDDEYNAENTDDEDDVYLLKNKKNSSKFVGYRKSFLNKLPFNFPRSKRHTNQKLKSIITSNRPNQQPLETTASKTKSNYLKKLFTNFIEKLFPTRFILNTENNNNEQDNSKAFKTFTKFLSFSKTTILITYSLLCVVLFMLNNDKEEIWYQSVVSSNSTYSFSYNNVKSLHEDIRLTKSQYMKCVLHGPFKDDKKSNQIGVGINTINYIRINIFENNKIYNTSTSNYQLPLSSWTVNLVESLDKNTYSQLSYATNIFKMDKKVDLYDIKFVFSTTSIEPLSINFDCKQLSQQASNKTLYATLLLIFVYGMIMFDLVHRTLAAALGAVGGITVISVVEMNRPTLTTIVSWVEWETLMLMFGMMIIVAIFCETGFFDLVAVQIFRYVGNRIWVMITSMCLLAAVLSAFLDNVTTILLLSPITIKLSEVLNLDPRHLLIAQVIFSNIGGASTAIGDPPNVIITANNVIRNNGVDFTNFTLHMLIGSIFVYIVAFIHFRFLYSNTEMFKSETDSEINDLNKEILIWKRSFKNITPITKEEKVVKTLLKEKVSQLQNLLTKRVYQMHQDKETNFRAKTDDLIQNYKINSYPLLIKCSIVFLSTLVLFFIHPFLTSIHLTIGWIAILSAIILLTITATSTSHNNASETSSGVDLEAVIHKVEWSTLLFFASLFIFMKTIEELGLLYEIGELVSNLIKSVENINDRLVVALAIIILTSAFVSSVIDNIPFTAAMIPIIIQLNETLDLPLQPLTYA